MNELEGLLETITAALQKLEGAPAILLVMAACIVAGYALKCCKPFPNEAIPIVVILLGGIAYPLIADANNDLTLRVWLVRNALIGLTVGFAAWLAHNQLLARLEDKFLGPKPSTPAPS